jgi:hypothetical protein
MPIPRGFDVSPINRVPIGAKRTRRDSVVGLKMCLTRPGLSLYRRVEGRIPEYLLVGMKAFVAVEIHV